MVNSYPGMTNEGLAQQEKQSKHENDLAAMERSAAINENQSNVRNQDELLSQKQALLDKGINPESPEGLAQLSTLRAPSADAANVNFVNPNAPVQKSADPMAQYVANTQKVNQAATDVANTEADVARQQAEVGQATKTKLDMLEGDQDAVKRYEEFKIKNDQFFKDAKDSMDKASQLSLHDPSIWANKSTGQKIAAGIGMMFAALTPQGTQNMMQMMTDAVNQDIDKQKNNITLARQSAQDKVNLYQMNLAKFKDEDMAKLMTENQVIKMGQQQAQLYAYNAKSDLIKKRNEQFKAVTNQQMAANQAAIQVKMVQSNLKNRPTVKEAAILNTADEAVSNARKYRVAIAAGESPNVPGTEAHRLKEKLLTSVAALRNPTGKESEGVRKNLEKEFPGMQATKQTKLKHADDLIDEVTGRAEAMKSSKPAGYNANEAVDTEAE